jgi:diacylglycerol kinase family enzyme
MRAILVHNPSAGDKSLSSDALIRMLNDAGYEPEVHSDVDLASLNAEMIIAAGGDGTVTKVVMEAPPGARVGVIPLGTANNIANSLGIAGRPEQIIAGWANSITKTIDIWRAQGPWGERTFIEGCGVGALTRAAHHMDDLEIKGHSPEHEISVARAAL